MRSPIILACALLASCAQPAPRFVWQNPDLQLERVESRRIVDSAECDAYAYQTIPDRPPSPDAGQEVNVTTNVYTEDSGIAALSPGLRGLIVGSELRRQAIEEGAAPIALTPAAQRKIEQQRRWSPLQIRRKLAEACMVERGWRKVSAEAERGME